MTLVIPEIGGIRRGAQHTSHQSHETQYREDAANHPGSAAADHRTPIPITK